MTTAKPRFAPPLVGITLAFLTGCGAAGSGHGAVSATARATATVRTPASQSDDGSAGGSAHTSLISVSRFGDQGDGDSYDPTLSEDGRFVAFVSGTDNLVSGDTNGRDDVFVRDTKTGVTTRINVSTTGAQGNGIRLTPPSVSIDGAGRYVAFQTDDSNLVPGSANTCTVVEPGRQPCPGIFVRDLRSGGIRLINVSDAGALANGPSQFPVISADGRYVAFLSSASNLVPGDTNHAWDVFVVDLKTSTIQRVSVSSTGAQADSDSSSVAISASGRYVAFDSAATTLVAGKPSRKVIGVFFRDLQTGKTQLVGLYGIPAQDDFGSVAMSPNGRYVAFDSRSDPSDIFIRDMETRTVERLSMLADEKTPGFIGIPVFDATGRYLTFTFQPTGPSSGNAPAQVLVRDLVAGTTRLVSVSDTGSKGDGISGEPAISRNGRYVAFSSSSPNLVSEDVLPGPEIFLRGPLN